MDISVPFLGQTSEITAPLGHCFAVFLLYTAFIMIRNPRFPQTNTYMHTHTHTPYSNKARHKSVLTAYSWTEHFLVQNPLHSFLTEFTKTKQTNKKGHTN